MKKEKKSGNWLDELRKSMAKRKLFLSTKERCLSHVKNAGLKEDELELPSNTSLHDIYSCPLSVYIDVVVDGKTKGLIISGSPTPEEIEEAKLKLITDFSDIAGGGEMQVFMDVLKSYHLHRSYITGLDLSLNLILSGRFESAVEYLNKNGIGCSVPESEDELKSLIAKIQLKLKNRLAKFKEISSRYKALSKGSEKPTRKYYNKLLIILSTCEVIKMQLNPKIMTVAEFAEYLNMFNEYQNHLKIKKNVKYRNH